MKKMELELYSRRDSLIVHKMVLQLMQFDGFHVEKGGYSFSNLRGGGGVKRGESPFSGRLETQEKTVPISSTTPLPFIKVIVLFF